MTDLHHKISSDQSTAVSTDIEWYPIDENTPMGVKVWAITTGKIGITTTLTHSTKKYFLGWYPIPKEPKWMKAMRVGVLGINPDYVHERETEHAQG